MFYYLRLSNAGNLAVCYLLNVLWKRKYSQFLSPYLNWVEFSRSSSGFVISIMFATWNARKYFVSYPPFVFHSTLGAWFLLIDNVWHLNLFHCSLGKGDICANSCWKLERCESDVKVLTLQLKLFSLFLSYKVLEQNLVFSVSSYIFLMQRRKEGPEIQASGRYVASEF